MCCLRNLFSDGFQTISNYFAANLYLADSGDWWPRMYLLFTDCIQTISKFSQALAVANFLSLGNLVIAGFLLFPTSWSSLRKLWEYLKIIVHAIMLVAGEWWWCRSNKTPEMKLIYIGVGRWRVTGHGQQTTYFCSCVLLRIVQIYLCVCVSHFLSHPHGSRPNCPHRNCPRPNLPGTIRRDQGDIKSSWNGEIQSKLKCLQTPKFCKCLNHR